MSIVIVGGNECMECKYKSLCKKYNCKAKVFTKESGMKKKIGNPDLLILFTNTVSHKMVQSTMVNIKNKNIKIERSHSSSISSLRNILEENVQDVAM